MATRVWLLCLLLATAIHAKQFYSKTHREQSAQESVTAKGSVGYAILRGSGQVDFELKNEDASKSIRCESLGVPVICLLWSQSRSDNPQYSLTFAVTPSSVGDVRQLSVEIVGGDFVELNANNAMKFIVNDVDKIPVTTNLGPILKFDAPNQQRIVFEIEKIRKTYIKDPFSLQISTGESSKRLRRFANIRTTFGYRSTQVQKSKCEGTGCTPFYLFSPNNVFSFVFTLVALPLQQKPWSLCEQGYFQSQDQLHQDGCGAHAVSSLKAGGSLGMFRFKDSDGLKVKWFHFDDSVWNEHDSKLPYVAQVLAKENGHSAVMRDAEGKSYTGVSIIKSSIFGRRGRFESINRMIEVYNRLAKVSPIPNVCTLSKMAESKETIYLMYDFCGAQFIDDVVVDDYFQRVANAKRLIHQYISALEALAAHGIYFEILRVENLRFDSNGTSINILDMPYILDTKEEQIGMGYQNESSPPETLMELVYSPEKATVWSIGVILYRLLYTLFPFTDTGIVSPAYFENIKKLTYWLPNDVDPSLKDLFARIFDFDRSRATLQEVKNHPWLKY